ncbi:hypothetical protein C8F01DRAFT_146725 [Mycena amicta]|nr:hypothetical protein C8F01DRAFT_146725 [Mycena amicta]
MSRIDNTAPGWRLVVQVGLLTRVEVCRGFDGRPPTSSWPPRVSTHCTNEVSGLQKIDAQTSARARTMPAIHTGTRRPPAGGPPSAPSSVTRVVDGVARTNVDGREGNLEGEKDAFIFRPWLLGARGRQRTSVDNGTNRLHCGGAEGDSESTPESGLVDTLTESSSLLLVIRLYGDVEPWSREGGHDAGRRWTTLGRAFDILGQENARS